MPSDIAATNKELRYFDNENILFYNRNIRKSGRNLLK